MFCEKALALVRELDRGVDSTLPPYNNDLMLEVCREILSLIHDNQRLARANDNNQTTGISYVSTVRLQHTAIQRNMRCLLVYHYNRLRRIRTMRWEFGSILPTDIKSTLNTAELNWFKDYNKCLADYMKNIGDAGGVNLCNDIKPPKSLYIEVRCLSDYGKFELNDGSVINLKKNSRYFLPRKDCEEFIRQGIFEHILA